MTMFEVQGDFAGQMAGRDIHNHGAVTIHLTVPSGQRVDVFIHTGDDFSRRQDLSMTQCDMKKGEAA